MAKLKAGRLVRELTDSCLQYWGGMGYMSEVEVSRMYRDTRLLSIGAGADEVMLAIIWSVPENMAVSGNGSATQDYSNYENNVITFCVGSLLCLNI